MERPSVYRYFRPFSITLYLSGQFPVINVLSHSAHLLQFRILSLPFICFCVLELLVGIHLFISMIPIEIPIYNKLVYSTFFLFKYSTLLWTKIKTKLIVQCLQELDKLRQCPSLIPYQISPENPNLFLWITFGLLLSIPMLSSLLFFIYILQEQSMTELPLFIFYGYYFSTSHYRIMVLVSLILYFCSLSVDDLMRVWDVHFSVSLPSRKGLRDYYNLMEDVKVTVIKIKTLLGSHLFVIILELVVRLLNGVCSDALFNSPESMNIFNLVQSVSLFWFMVSTIGLPSLKFEKLTEDIFSTELKIQDLTRRDAARIKTILVEIEDNPGEMNTAGYGSIDRSVFLWYLCLSIEYLILLWQNKELIREFASKMG